MNRLAQRYLVRGVGGTPVVGIPESDLVESASWILQDAPASGTFDLISAADPHISLHTAGGALVWDVLPDPRSGRGSWILEPVNDDSGFKHIVSATDPALVLGVADDRHGTVANLRVGSRKGRSSMWSIEQDCVADARSVHLRYHTPPEMSLFYNEVSPQDSWPGTFYCTTGFGADSLGAAPSGYAGIQQRGDGSKRAIFSVWHRMADQETPVRGALATTVAAHAAAHQTAFSGEGVGSSIRLPLDWRAGTDEVVRWALTAEAMGRDTVITAYVARGSEDWISLGAIVRAETGGRLLGKSYAFIEDFARTGNTAGISATDRSPYQLRSGVFSNPWCVTSAGPSAVTRTRLTVYSPHRLENVTAVPAGDNFGLRVATGGHPAPATPPIGARFADPSSRERRPPDLSGVPYGVAQR